MSTERRAGLSGPRQIGGPERTALQWAAIALLYLLVTLWMTRPVVTHAFTAVAGWPGDNLYFVWLLEWYRDALGRGHLPLHVPQLNVPEGWTLAYNEMSPAVILPGLPGFLVSGAAFAYNVTFWLTFVLSALFTAIWVYRLIGRYPPAIVAGLMFGFAPYRLSHAMGHLNLLGTHWLPLYFLAITEVLTGGGAGWAVVTAVAIVGLAGTSQYYLYMTALISVPYAAVILRARSGWTRDARLWRRAGIAAAIAVPVVLLLELPYFALAKQGTLATHDIRTVAGWSASPTDYFLPSPQHWAVGGWIDAHFDRRLWIENTITPGFVAIVLAALGWRVRRSAGAAVASRAIVLCLAVAFVLSLGTDWHWLSRTVRVPTPTALRDVVGTDRMPIPLPGLVLFNVLPFYGGMRVWMRWGIYVGLFLSVLAAFGIDRLTRNRRAWTGVAIAAAIGVLVLLEFGQRPYTVATVGPRPVDTWLAARPDSGPLVQLPPAELLDPEHTLYTVYNRQPFVGAPFSDLALHARGGLSFPQLKSPLYTHVEERLLRFPEPDTIEMLHGLGVRWVIVDLTKYPDAAALKSGAIRAGLQPMYEAGGQLVFRMR